MYIYTVYSYIRMICLSKIDMINLIYSTFLHFSLNSAMGFPFLESQPTGQAVSRQGSAKTAKRLRDGPGYVAFNVN